MVRLAIARASTSSALALSKFHLKDGTRRRARGSIVLTILRAILSEVEGLTTCSECRTTLPSPGTQKRARERRSEATESKGPEGGEVNTTGMPMGIQSWRRLRNVKRTREFCDA